MKVGGTGSPRATIVTARPTRIGRGIQLAVRDVVHGRVVKNKEALDLYKDLAELRS